MFFIIYFPRFLCVFRPSGCTYVHTRPCIIVWKTDVYPILYTYEQQRIYCRNMYTREERIFPLMTKELIKSNSPDSPQPAWSKLLNPRKHSLAVRTNYTRFFFPPFFPGFLFFFFIYLLVYGFITFFCRPFLLHSFRTDIISVYVYARYSPNTV